MYTLPRYRYVKSSSPLFLRRCRYDDGWREGSHVRNDSLNGGRVSIDRSIGALYQLGCGQAGVQSEYNCRIFSADHTLHILRADIYVGIMFGMLMRSLGSPPFPLFRPTPLAHTLFPQFFDTSKHLGRCVYIYIYVVPSLFERDSNVFSNRLRSTSHFRLARIVPPYVTFVTTKSIDLLGIGDPRSTRCSHYSSIVTSRFIASMIYTRLGQTI